MSTHNSIRSDGVYILFGFVLSALRELCLPKSSAEASLLTAWFLIPKMVSPEKHKRNEFFVLFAFKTSRRWRDGKVGREGKLRYSWDG